MTILVTGGAGFIGSTLVARLVEYGEKITILDNLSNYYSESIKRENIRRLLHLGSQVEFIEADCRDAKSFVKSLKNLTAVVHLAGQPGVRSSWRESFATYADNNILATQQLLEAIVGHASSPRFVYGSSSSIYGNNASYPSLESDLPQPYSPYAVTKLAGEHLVGLYLENFDVDSVSLRFFTVYGPRQRPEMAFAQLFHAARTGEPFSMLGDGTQLRDFTYVEDVVSAIMKAVYVKTLPNRIYNVAGGTSVSLSDVIPLIESTTQRSVPIIKLPADPGDVRQTGGSTQLLRSELDWQPKVHLAEGLQLQWEEVCG